MALIGRRDMLAAGATLLAGGTPRKSAADEPGGFRKLSDIAPDNRPLPPLSFTRLDGQPFSLAAVRGKPVVLNFWATWCAPCVAELPELDKLAAGGTVAVIAASADRGGAARVQPFLAAHPLTHLTVVLDPQSDAAHAVEVAGFPTTLLIDANGKLRGRLEGPAVWGGAAGIVAEITK